MRLLIDSLISFAIRTRFVRECRSNTYVRTCIFSYHRTDIRFGIQFARFWIPKLFDYDETIHLIKRMAEWLGNGKKMIRAFYFV